MPSKNVKQGILSYLTLILLIIIAWGFYAQWRHERMLQSWESAEGVVIHLELPDVIAKADATKASAMVVFNYTAEDDRVYQGAVRAGKLMPAESGFRHYFQQDVDVEPILTPLEEALDFLLKAEIGAVFDYGTEQPVTLRLFEENRRLRVPFDAAPRLALRYHPETPERYRLEDLFTPSATLYRNGFLVTMLVAILYLFFAYLRDNEAQPRQGDQEG